MTTDDTNRHLLLGLFAFQNEFVSKEQLLVAFGSWLANKSLRIDQLLVAQHALSAEDRRLLDRLVDQHLKRFSGDATQSLARLSSVDEVRESMLQLAATDAAVLKTLLILPAGKRGNDNSSDGIQDGSIQVRSSGLNRFKIIKLHAQGGLGAIYLAEDLELHREVALKRIRQDCSQDVIFRAKFNVEATVTGQLEHPGIVPVYALGSDDHGHPYYAMRFIRGENLQSRVRTFHAQRRANKQSLDSSELRELLRRFVDVCNAVDYAHDRGVLHRDLKPGNVMLGKHGETLVVDWGLAKPHGRSMDLDPDDARILNSELPVQPSDTESAAGTRHGSTVGTPAYAPPEQLLGQLDRIGPCSDVYALGAILFELLTGHVPATGDSVQEIIANAIQGNIPRPLSLEPTVPRPLEAICRKAMSLRIEDRHPSVNLLKNDVEAWLNDSPVPSYQEPSIDRIKRYFRRHPAAAAGLTVSVLLGTAAITLFGVVVSSHNAALQSKNRDIQTQADELNKSNQSILAQSQLLRQMSAESALIAGAIAFDSGKVDLGRRSLLSAYAFSKADPRFNDEVSQILMDRLTERGTSLFGSQLDEGTQVLVFSPDGKKFATATSRRILRIWDSQSGLPLTDELPHEGPILSIAFHPNGKQVAVLTWYHVQVWDAESGDLVLPSRLMKENEIWRGYKLMFSPEGSRLFVFRSRTDSTEGVGRAQSIVSSERTQFALANVIFLLDIKGESGQLLILDTRTGFPVADPITHESEFITAGFARDGNEIVTYDLSSIRSIDVDSGTVVSQKELDSNGDFGVFDANAMSLATWSPKRNTVRIWDAHTGKEKFSPLAQQEQVQRVEFLADGDGIAVTCESHIQYWDNISGDRHRARGTLLDTSETLGSSFPTLRPTICAVSNFDYFGEELWPRVSRSPDNTQQYERYSTRLTTLDAAMRTPLGLAEYEFEILNRILSGDGKHLTTVSGWNQKLDTVCVLRVQNIVSGEILGSPIHVSGGVLSIAMSLDASRIACTARNKQVTLWDTNTGRMVTEPIHVNEVVEGMEFSDDNNYLVTQSMPKYELRERNIEFDDKTYTSEICLWETNSGKLLAGPFDNGSSKKIYTDNRAFSSDGRHFAVISRNLGHLIQTQTGNEVCRIGNDEQIVRAFAFSPNAEYWVTVGSRVEIRRTIDGGLVSELADDQVRNYSRIAFSPSGTKFALGSLDGMVQIVECPTCRPLGISTRHGDQVQELKFFSDGRRLKVRSLDALTGLFDSSTMELVEQLDFWEFSHDGRRLVEMYESSLALRGLERRSIRIWDASHVLRIGAEYELSDRETPRFFEFDKSGSSLAMQTQASMTIWDIRPPVLPTTESTRQAFFELLSRYKVIENGRTEPLTHADRENRYQIVKQDAAFWKTNLEMQTERKSRWHTAECNNAVQEQDFATAEFHLRWLRSLTSDEEIVTTIEPIQGKVNDLKKRFAQFQKDLVSAEMGASTEEWQETSACLLRASAFLKKEPSEEYRRVAHMLIASLIMRADQDSRQQARQILFQPEVLSPGKPIWNLLFACWLFQSTPEERQGAAEQSQAWYLESGYDKSEHPNWLVAWVSAFDDEPVEAVTVLEKSVVNFMFDEGDLLFWALALKNSGDFAGGLAKTQLCRKKFYEQWGDAETIRRRPWQERLGLEMFRGFLDQLEKSLN